MQLPFALLCLDTLREAIDKEKGNLGALCVEGFTSRIAQRNVAIALEFAHKSRNGVRLSLPNTHSC
ncbi:MAG: hypothetical protein WBG86_15995 [Polyangiales bacterium]